MDGRTLQQIFYLDVLNTPDTLVINFFYIVKLCEIGSGQHMETIVKKDLQVF